MASRSKVRTAATVESDWPRISRRLDIVAAETGTQRTLPKRLRPPHVTVFDPRWAIEAAEILGVDPRWLLLGVPAPAAQAAATYLLRNGFSKYDDVISLVRMMPEVARFPGVCRYCGCTDEHGCGDCYWLDPKDGSTICSSCLMPEL